MNKTNTYKNTYGGYVDLKDFEGRQTIADIARDIMHDEVFDRQCKKNIVRRCGGDN